MRRGQVILLALSAFGFVIGAFWYALNPSSALLKETSRESARPTLAQPPAEFVPQLPRFLDGADKRKFQDAVEDVLKLEAKMEEMTAATAHITSTRPLVGHGFGIPDLMANVEKAQGLLNEIKIELVGFEPGTRSLFKRYPLYEKALGDILPPDFMQVFSDYKLALLRFDKAAHALQAVTERHPTDSNLIEQMIGVATIVADEMGPSTGSVNQEIANLKIRAIKTIQAIP